MSLRFRGYSLPAFYAIASGFVKKIVTIVTCTLFSTVVFNLNPRVLYGFTQNGDPTVSYKAMRKAKTISIKGDAAAAYEQLRRGGPLWRYLIALGP